MSWDRIRATARRIVHNTFAREATYTAPGVGESPVAARIRLHTKFLTFGDLDREGYARVIDDVNEVRIDIGEITPARHGTISITGVAQYKIDNVLPDKDSDFWVCQVQPV